MALPLLSSNRLAPVCAFLILGAAFLTGLTGRPLEWGVEWADSNDISLLQANWQGDFQRSSWESTFSFAYGDYDLDYVPVPFDFNGREIQLRERNLAANVNTKYQASRYWAWMGGTGMYDGFTNYRSIWLDEYYRQQYSNLGDAPGAENYVEADPKGINATLGARWEYLPAAGYAQVNLSWLQDDVSPGYEIDFDGLRRGDLTLTTRALHLSSENILSKYLRSYVGIRFTDTTARSPRYGVDAELFAALGQSWTARLQAGAATEHPQFEAVYAGVALEKGITGGLSCFADLRHYDDTGEIENALLFTSAAPGLRSKRVGFGLRWMRDRWSARFYLAHLDTDYDPTRENLDFFQNLYKDRDWTLCQFAISRTL